ncbi:MAG: TIM barrel protein [Fimbriimonadaceae bacterium]|jgi:sugar phosphate isomerase/epimerase|nr:TIM barrel protein [Fimbriimonadaceae bacterium]
MRFGIGTYSLPRTIWAGEIDEEGLLALATDLGCDAVQFCENMPWTGRLTPPSGLVVETGTRGIDPEDLVRHLRWATQHDSGFVRLVVDQAEFEPSPSEVVTLLKPIVREYAEAGVRLCLENHDRFTSPVLKSIIDDLGEGAGVVIDSANSLGALEGLDQVVDNLGSACLNFHAKDVKAVRKPDLLGFDVIGTTCGEGQIDFPGILPRLANCVSVTLEQWVPAGFDDQGRELAGLKNGVTYLKGVMT